MHSLSKNAKTAIFAILFALLFLTAYSQEKFGNPDETEKSKVSSQFFGDAQLAMSTPDYPVTAGDVYTLSFIFGNSPFTYTIPLDSTYKIRVANLGVLNCKGLTFNQLKNQVLLLVTKNYPMSGAQFVLSASSNFFVSITGEVQKASEQKVWALTRLSDVVSENLTEYSSIRNIKIISESNEEKTYDLFKAQRTGDFSQNPYLRPNDKIVINRLYKKVTINGAVERSGTYELLEGENLQQLIFYYANGLAPLADTSRIELFRAITEKDDSGEKLYLSKSDIENDFELSCYDEVTISSFKELTPTIFVEGAVNTGASANASMSNRIAASVNNGEDYAFFARRNKAWFSSISDLENAYIIRGGDIIPINLSKVLYDASFYSKIEIMADDVLRIPFKQFFVSVSGAVNAPGRYPFIPDRKWDYYVALAGGIIKSQNSRDSLEITALNGDSLSKNDIILPESIIDVKTNSTLYYFNQYAPILTTIFSLVATSLSILVISGAL